MGGIEFSKRNSRKFIKNLLCRGIQKQQIRTVFCPSGESDITHGIREVIHRGIPSALSSHRFRGFDLNGIEIFSSFDPDSALPSRAADIKPRNVFLI